MRLRVKAEERPPVGLRLALPGEVALQLDSYSAYVRESTGRKMERKELAVEMIGQFLESDKQFRRWLGSRSGSESGLESENGAGEESHRRVRGLNS